MQPPGLRGRTSVAVRAARRTRSGSPGPPPADAGGPACSRACAARIVRLWSGSPSWALSSTFWGERTEKQKKSRARCQKSLRDAYVVRRRGRHAVEKNRFFRVGSATDLDSHWAKGLAEQRSTAEVLGHRMGNRRKRFLPRFRLITKTGGISPATRRDQNMPEHIGAFSKLKVFGQFLMVNLGQSRKMRDLRKKRLTTKNIRNRLNGTPDAPNNRAKYVPWKHIMQVEKDHLKKFEREYEYYEMFREFLDRADPAQPRIEGRVYTDQREWDLCLQPGTPFDELVQQYFESRRGKLLVIFHKREFPKLKRIEAIPKDEEPVIIWSDAS